MMFRTFFDGEFAMKAKVNIEREDSLKNLVHAVTSWCFFLASSRILDEEFVGINVIRILLESVGDSYGG